jgi:hypothetical protein
VRRFLTKVVKLKLVYQFRSGELDAMTKGVFLLCIIGMFVSMGPARAGHPIVRERKTAYFRLTLQIAPTDAMCGEAGAKVKQPMSEQAR